MRLPPGRRADGDGLAVLLARIGRGDQAAFTVLYQRTVPQVLGLVTLMLGDTEAAEEVTAAVYQQLWHTAACYDPARGGADTWLLGAAHREAAGHLRARRGNAAACAGTATGGPACLPADLERLDAPARELILLVYYGGCTAAQAARLLGLPAGTAGPRLHAALEALSTAPPPAAAAAAREPIGRPRRAAAAGRSWRTSSAGKTIPPEGPG
jgi:RNA polymerase sigma-70 factor, ECF subfamily